MNTGFSTEELSEETKTTLIIMLSGGITALIFAVLNRKKIS